MFKNRLGRQRPSKAPPRPPPRKSGHPFGHLLGPFFSIFLHFMIKKVGSEICNVFSLILGSPWALHGMGSHAIRTRLRSRNTLFRFCILFWKIGSTWLHFDSILEPFFVNNHNFEWKKELQKMDPKKVTPPSQTAGYEQARRLPEAGTLSRIVRARNNCSNTCWSNCSSFCLKM